jgi:hypothetical protein
MRNTTYNSPLVALKLLLGRLLDTHALRLRLLARSRALTPLASRNRRATAEGWVLMSHFRLIHLAQALGNSVALVEFREDGTETTRRRSRRGSILCLDIQNRRRARGRRWRRSSSSRRSRSRRRRGVARQRFYDFLGGLSLRIPWDTCWEILLDIIGKITEHLVETLNPLDLLGIPNNLVRYVCVFPRT